MLDESALGEGWTVWSAEDDRLVLAYRPDVFDGSTFPAACLPTVYVSRGRPNRRPSGARTAGRDAPWTVTLRLEPSVEHSSGRYDARADALENARRVTERFADGEIDYRSLYQVPREAYFRKLDELTGRPDADVE